MSNGNDGRTSGLHPDVEKVLARGTSPLNPTPMPPNRLAVLEELSAALGPVIGVWGLALGSQVLILAGVVLVFVSALCNRDRWVETDGLVAIFAVGAYIGDQ